MSQSLLLLATHHPTHPPLFSQAALAVLMNMTHDHLDGVRAMAEAGGFEIVAHLVVECCGVDCQPHQPRQDSQELQLLQHQSQQQHHNPQQGQQQGLDREGQSCTAEANVCVRRDAVLHHLEVLSVCLGLLINMTSLSPENRERLRHMRLRQEGEVVVEHGKQEQQQQQQQQQGQQGQDTGEHGTAAAGKGALAQQGSTAAAAAAAGAELPLPMDVVVLLCAIIRAMVTEGEEQEEDRGTEAPAAAGPSAGGAGTGPSAAAAADLSTEAEGAVAGIAATGNAGGAAVQVGEGGLGHTGMGGAGGGQGGHAAEAATASAQKEPRGGGIVQDGGAGAGVRTLPSLVAVGPSSGTAGEGARQAPCLGEKCVGRLLRLHADLASLHTCIRSLSVYL